MHATKVIIEKYNIHVHQHQFCNVTRILRHTVKSQSKSRRSFSCFLLLLIRNNNYESIPVKRCPLVLLSLIFFIWGLITVSSNSLIPYYKEASLSIIKWRCYFPWPFYYANNSAASNVICDGERDIKAH